MKTRNIFSLFFIGLEIFFESSCRKDIDQTFNIIKENYPPVSNAGPDQIIVLPVDSIILNGSTSNDPDGTISEWQWTKISGPVSFIIIRPFDPITTVKSLIAGIYEFELKVTDDEGLFSKDTIQILVQVVNHQSACTDCKIVFVSDRDGNDEIYSCTIDGFNIQRLTNDNGYDYQPTWSPDGTKIAFISDRSRKNELYVMNKDGSNLVRKTFYEGYVSSPAWSPDGTKIIYSTLSNGSANLWVIPAIGGLPSLLFEAPGGDNQPTWSPDGTKIALVSDYAAYDFVYDIYTINADGTGFTALTGNIFDPFNYLSPSWSPSAAKLAMAVSETIGIDQYYTQIGIMNSNGSGIKIISSEVAPWSKTSWSGDGTRIAYTSLSGSGRDVSWVSEDGNTGGIIIANGWDADWQH